MLVRRSTCVGPLGGSNSRGIRGGGAAPGQQPRRYNRGTGGSRYPKCWHGSLGWWEAAQLAKNTAPGDQQPPANTTFAGKKGLVVDGSRAGGESSAVRPWGEAQEQHHIRALALKLTTARTRGKAPRGARVARLSAKQPHVRLTSVSRPVARQGRTGRRSGRRRRGRTRRQAEAFFTSYMGSKASTMNAPSDSCERRHAAARHPETQ